MLLFILIYYFVIRGFSNPFCINIVFNSSVRDVYVHWLWRWNLLFFLSFLFFFEVEWISGSISFLSNNVKFLNSIATTWVHTGNLFLETLCFYMISLILVFQLFIVINKFQFLSSWSFLMAQDSFVLKGLSFKFITVTIFKSNWQRRAFIKGYFLFY